MDFVSAYANPVAAHDELLTAPPCFERHSGVPALKSSGFQAAVPLVCTIFAPKTKQDKKNLLIYYIMCTTPSGVELVNKYFPNLTAEQRAQFGALGALYADWNQKINVISRKDIDNLYIHHVLHSLGLAKVITFRPGTAVMDVGTGGGFPGIPLAILFPDVTFHLVDSIGKKIRVAQEVAQAIGLANVTFAHENVKEEKQKFDFVVNRAVMDLSEMCRLVRKNIRREQHNSLPNGLFSLKGGDLSEELRPFGKRALTWNLKDYFEEDFFETKHVVYVMLE